MEKVQGALLCLVVVIIDLIAGILGIEAEIAQDQMRYIRYLIFECKEPSHQAFDLGLIAAALLASAHILASLLGGCICFFSKEDLRISIPSKKISAISLILSWIILAVGFTLLVIGAMSNSKSRRLCGISHHNFLTIGGVLCFFHGLVCVVFYVSATTLSEQEKAHLHLPQAGAQMTRRAHQPSGQP